VGDKCSEVAALSVVAPGGNPGGGPIWRKPWNWAVSSSVVVSRSIFGSTAPPSVESKTCKLIL